MKLLLLAFLLLLPAISAAQQTQSLVTREYDRFEDRTRYFAEPILIRSGLELTVSFSFRGKGAGNEIEGFWFTFLSKYPDWRFSNNARLYCRIDGQSFDLGNPAAKDAQVDLKSELFRAQEILVFRLKYETLKKLADAKDVELRLGDTGFLLYSNDRAKLSALLDRVQIVKKARWLSRSK